MPRKVPVSACFTISFTEWLKPSILFSRSRRIFALRRFSSASSRFSSSSAFIFSAASFLDVSRNSYPFTAFWRLMISSSIFCISFWVSLNSSVSLSSCSVYSAICCPAFSRRETVSSAALSAVTISTRLSALSAVKAFRRLTSFSILRDIFSLLVSRSERCFSSSASFRSVSAFCTFFSSAAACLFSISSAAAASETPNCSASACKRSKD